MRDSEETGVQFSREDFCQLSYSGLMGLKIGFFYMDLTYFLGYAKAHMDHLVGPPMCGLL